MYQLKTNSGIIQIFTYMQVYILEYQNSTYVAFVSKTFYSFINDLKTMDDKMK